MRARVPVPVWRRRRRPTCLLLPSRTARQVYSYYSTVISRTNRGEEVVHINCRSNGSIALKYIACFCLVLWIRNANHHIISILQPLVAGQSSPANVIIYLPTGPVGCESAIIDDDQIIAALSAASNATIVRVNYRLGNGVRYPTPIHDVLTAFDWLKANLPTAKLSTTRRGRPFGSLSRYGVCGQLVGGSLATMLALTESRLGESRIAAAAVSNPIVDWVFPEEDEITITSLANSGEELMEHSFTSMKALAKSKKRSKPPSSWDQYKDEETLPTSALLSARRQLFRKPSSYFDSFASPILFFRSPSASVPQDENAFDESESDDIDTGTSSTSTRRKAHKVFPPTASALVLPDMRISLGEATPLYDQGEELVKLLRRSIIRTHEGRAGNQAILDRFEEEEIGETRKTAIALEEAERRIEFHMPGHIGIWGSPSEPGWRNDVMDAGVWFRKVLG
jgi:acetyl esterase/lipase